METKTKNIQFRLPTKEELEDLIDNHFTKWNKEKGGLEVMNKKGDILFLPACGYRKYTYSYDMNSSGYYWSSTVDESDSNGAYSLCFYSTTKHTNSSYTGYRRTVRLVSDTPFDGSVEFNGVYWKPENEEGYFTYYEAMIQFNK